MKKICKESVEPMVATIAIPKKKLDRLNDLLENGCDYEEAGIDPDSHVFSATAKFPDGIEADLNVCSEEEGSDGFWSEVCLYNEDGQEVALGEPSYGALEGEWEFEVNGNVYVVKIVAAGEDEKKLRELGQRIDEDSNKEIVPEFEKLRVEVTDILWDLSDGAEDDVGGDDVDEHVGHGLVGRGRRGLHADDGSHVEADTTVAVVEAMKVMNEIKAEKSGVIKEILLENGQPVEYGQPLFVLE